MVLLKVSTRPLAAGYYAVEDTLWILNLLQNL